MNHQHSALSTPSRRGARAHRRLAGLLGLTALLALTHFAGLQAPAIAQEAAARSDSEADTLRSAVLLFRHGVISPKYAPPKNATEWPMGFRQLTPVGIRGMFDEGTRLRQRYVEHLGLVGASYHRDQVYVRSSSTDRALQSAQMLTMGLFPLGSGGDPALYDPALQAAPSADLAFTPVPIHAVALENDAVMRPWTGRADCKRYRDFVKRLQHTELYAQKGKEHEKFLRRVSAVMGVNEGKKIGTVLYLINEVYEPLSANLHHDLPLPEGISRQDMERMAALADWNYHHQFLGKTVGRLTGGNFVGEVLENFERVQAGHAEAKRLYLYSGHQRTMLGVEAALGIETARTEGPMFEGRVPPLGSHYAFELHEMTTGGPAVRLRFIAGEAAETIRIPGCDADFCALSTFRQAVAAAIARDWRRECRGR